MVAALVAVLHFAFGVVRVSGSGMRPTAGDGDLALFARFGGTPKSDDVVAYEADGKLQLGRIVAQAGDTVKVTDDGEPALTRYAQAIVTVNKEAEPVEETAWQ